MYLYCEDDYGADGCDQVGDDKRDISKKYSLDNKKHRSEAEHKECGECYSVGVASSDCSNSLGQISEYHAEGCAIACNGNNGIHEKVCFSRGE